MTAAALDISPRMAEILGAFTQARELWSTSEQIEELPAPKRSDQRKRQVRPVLAAPAARRRKYAVETGYDTRSGRFLKAPLEPWTCENPQAAYLLYQEISAAPGGSLHIGQYRGKDLGRLGYMASEKLIGFDTRGWIHMLGDPLPAAERSRYPGAAVPDSRAAIGKQLRDHAKALVVGALIRLRDRESLLKLSRAQRRELAEWRDRGGIPFSIRTICHEANLIRRHLRPDLAGCRWLSVSTCGRVLRLLRAAGVLTLLQPARRYRANRQWQCSPAVCAVASGPPERKKRPFRRLPHDGDSGTLDPVTSRCTTRGCPSRFRSGPDRECPVCRRSESSASYGAEVSRSAYDGLDTSALGYARTPLYSETSGEPGLPPGIQPQPDLQSLSEGIQRLTAPGAAPLQQVPVRPRADGGR